MKNLFLQQWLLLALLSVTVLGCDKNEDDQMTIQPTDCTTSALVRDLAGLDGCGLVFELAGLGRSAWLEPSNLDQFSYLPVDGETVCITYEVVEDATSICMVGTVIELTSLLPAEN
ncbi:hypothetical protein CEQ90_04940 [Lewinellaceae bacterium SD302]|nr:hypothetical protein CEQ90_04940 [Lewinellaceae bacterium SD302]